MPPPVDREQRDREQRDREQRDEEQRRLTSMLRGIASRETARLRDGTRPWTWWLERAVLHGRRFGYTNTLLIAAQWRAATDVRSYEEWRAAGRQVRRGEAGIRVFGPSGRVRAVFDVAQTTGLPLPPVPPPPVPAGDVSAVPGWSEQVRHLRAVEADSVSYLVRAWLGLGPRPPVFPVNAFWAGQDAGDRILRLSRRLYADACPDARSDARSAGSSSGGGMDAASGGVMDAAHRFFQARRDGGWVPAYLAGRGFSPGVQRRWQIGHAPPGPRALTDHLRGLGHGDEEIVASGLARHAEGDDLYDTFRDRLMFAVRTPDGAIAGFLGRRRDGADGPKYLNSPATALFHKSELLYGLHEARDRLAAGARPVLVEGPLDAIAVTVAATGHAAVATCGVSLTGAQLAALGGVADLDATGVLVAMDGDPAGRSGAVRAWETLAPVGGPVDAVTLPPGRDPADLLRDGGRAAVRHALRARAPLADAVVDAAIDRAGGTLATAEQRLAAIRAAASVIAARPVEAARQAVRTAERADVPAWIVTEALIEAARRPRRGGPPRPPG